MYKGSPCKGGGTTPFATKIKCYNIPEVENPIYYD